MMAVMEVEEKIHKPVMLNEVLEYLSLKPGMTVVDATIGMGGHSLSTLERICPGGKLIGIDRDEESLELARSNLKDYSGSFELLHGSFSDIDSLLAKQNISKVDGILLDLGISSFQLDSAERGFSFQNDGPLDMRMDRSSYISAYDLVNNLNEEEISTLLWNFGQERWHNRIARSLVRERQKAPIATTAQLSEIVMRAIPYQNKHYRIHPATRTFQAVRIAVNRELETLESALNKSIELLNAGGRICVISFHSLEDRVVKLRFRDFASREIARIITPKPLTPLMSEMDQNPRSRSSKFRVAEKI